MKGMDQEGSGATNRIESGHVATYSIRFNMSDSLFEMVALACLNDMIQIVLCLIRLCDDHRLAIKGWSTIILQVHQRRAKA